MSLYQDSHEKRSRYSYFMDTKSASKSRPNTPLSWFLARLSASLATSEVAFYVSRIVRHWYVKHQGCRNTFVWTDRPAYYKRYETTDELVIYLLKWGRLTPDASIRHEVRAHVTFKWWLLRDWAIKQDWMRAPQSQLSLRGGVVGSAARLIQKAHEISRFWIRQTFWARRNPFISFRLLGRNNDGERGRLRSHINLNAY